MLGFGIGLLVGVSIRQVVGFLHKMGALRNLIRLRLT